MVCLKQYNHDHLKKKKSSFVYKIQPVDSGHLARGELINIEFMRLNHKVNGGIK